MTIEAYATQVMADLDALADYSTRRLVLLAALKKAQEMEGKACAAILDAEAKYNCVDKNSGHINSDVEARLERLAEEIRQRT